MATKIYTKGGVRRRKDTFTPMSRAAVPAVKPVVRTTTNPTSSANLPVGPTMLVPRAVLPEGKPQKTKAPFEPTLQGTPTPKRPKGATKKRTVKPTASANLPVGQTMLAPTTDLPEEKPQKTKAPLEPTLQGTSAPKGPKGATKKRTHISALRLLIAQLPDNERERALANCACAEASQEKVILASFLVKGEVDAATKKVADDQLPAIVKDKAMTARRAIYGWGKRPTKSAIRKALETFLSPNDGHRMPLIIEDDDLNIVQIKALASTGPRCRAPSTPGR